MSFEKIIFGIYYISIGIAIFTSLILLRSLRKYASKLPEEWRSTPALKRLYLGICFLSIYFLLEIASDAIGTYLAIHHIYNNFVHSIYGTISTPLVFGFLFIHTQKLWKKIAYVILYSILVGHLISEGCYDPKSTSNIQTELIFNSVYFLSALLHLTDLLITQRRDFFSFQLKINLTFLVWALMGAIISSFYTSFTSQNQPHYVFFYVVNVFIMVALHLSLTFIFITEILKLRRG